MSNKLKDKDSKDKKKKDNYKDKKILDYLMNQIINQNMLKLLTILQKLLT